MAKWTHRMAVVVCLTAKALVAEHEKSHKINYSPIVYAVLETKSLATTSIRCANCQTKIQSTQDLRHPLHILSFEKFSFKTFRSDANRRWWWWVHEKLVVCVLAMRQSVMVYDIFPVCVPNVENGCCRWMRRCSSNANRTIFRNDVIVLLTWMGHTLLSRSHLCVRYVYGAHDKCQRKCHVRAFIISICACVFISSLNSIFCCCAAENSTFFSSEFLPERLVSVCLWRIRLLCRTDWQVVASACAFL